MEKKLTLQRKCVITGEKCNKNLLFRVIRTPEGIVQVDQTERANGRGAYLKKNKEVILKAQKNKVLERHLGVKVPDEIYQKLLSFLD